MEYIKSPLNYVGGKFKLLPQIMPYLNEGGVSCFVDLFGGGFNVGLNVECEQIIYNDMLTPLTELWKHLYTNTYTDVINYITDTIQLYDLSKQDKDSFNQFRDMYNHSVTKNPLDLYILSCFSFNHLFRFNNKKEYNVSHGTNRSQFTSNMKHRLKECMCCLHSKNILFSDVDFYRFDFDSLPEDSLVYCDPPYLISTASYNDGNRGFKDWNIREERRLLEILTVLNENDTKFALSNVLTLNGKQNKWLSSWIKKNSFNVHQINSDYTNSSYNKRDHDKQQNKEVLVTNY